MHKERHMEEAKKKGSESGKMTYFFQERGLE